MFLLLLSGTKIQPTSSLKKQFVEKIQKNVNYYGFGVGFLKNPLKNNVYVKLLLLANIKGLI